MNKIFLIVCLLLWSSCKTQQPKTETTTIKTIIDKSFDISGIGKYEIKPNIDYSNLWYKDTNKHDTFITYSAKVRNRKDSIKVVYQPKNNLFQICYIADIDTNYYIEKEIKTQEKESNLRYIIIGLVLSIILVIIVKWKS